MQNFLAEHLLNEARKQMMANDHAGASPLVNEALRMDPKNIRGLCFGAVVAAKIGQKDRALNLIKVALKLAPDDAKVISNAAGVLYQCGRPHRARRLWERLAELLPPSVETLSNLAVYHSNENNVSEAEMYFRKVLELVPNARGLRTNLGNMVFFSGRIEEAVSLYRQDSELAPQDISIFSVYLYSLHFHPLYGPEQIQAALSAWGQTLEASIAGRTDHGNERSPDRQLRVGYVSPNLRNHVVGFNLLPLLREHDHSQFKIHCYSDSRAPDEMTGRLRQHADVWHDTAGLTDAELAELVSHDQIDVLVDLVMHLRGVRLGMFARKPAPVQIAWMAYPGSTGLTRMDYRLTDAVLDPPGTTDHLYTEQSIRLETFWCFEPPADSPPVGPLPADENGHFTFGCLNGFWKVNAALLELWREVLAAVPDSRLVILPPKGNSKAWALEKLQIEPARLVCLPAVSRIKYLGYYNGIDLALDPVPYTGHTTTLEGLWMGVPVVSLAGPTIASRGSLSILSNLGLADLVVKTKSDYAALAIELSKDLPRLRKLRAELRGRLERSVLMDAERFARKAESAYREMWHKWCRTARAN
jgi:predicted O-linked N-acetylglucosamine transferase (SPINDLY family)